MRILWLCNTLLPHVAERLSLPKTKPESWISGTAEVLSAREDVELIYLFPAKAELSLTEGRTHFLSYPQGSIRRLEKKQVAAFVQILRSYTPDVIHVFGTEYPHAYAMLLAAKEVGLLDALVVHLQGLCSMIARHYFAGIPFSARHGATLRDLLRRDNAYMQMLTFRRRGALEVRALSLARHVLGRTDFDRATVSAINSDANYHFVNETLRSAFYQHRWQYDACEKHSIFVSQSSYPLKGFHIVLKEMARILKRYPEAVLYTTGTDPRTLSPARRLRTTFYQLYLGRLLRKYRLGKHVVFLGHLNEEEMCERYLRSHVFVSASSLENSSNSVGEAMILGVPTVSSDVGGISSLLSHGQEGYLYPFGEPEMLTHYVSRIFDEKEKAERMSALARERALRTHDREENLTALLSTYEKLAKGDKL